MGLPLPPRGRLPLACLALAVTLLAGSFHLARNGETELCCSTCACNTPATVKDVDGTLLPSVAAQAQAKALGMLHAKMSAIEEKDAPRFRRQEDEVVEMSRDVDKQRMAISRLVQIVQRLKERDSELKRKLKRAKKARETPGPEGEPGRRGLMGPPGPKGPPAMGIPGMPGPPGPPGLSGKPGMYGPRGHAGAQGKMGRAGKPGRRGRRGFPGKTGPEGGTGEHGVDGTAGLRGPTGEQGPVGAVGKAGLPGVRGPAGLHGLPGPQGPIGTDGARGMRGTNGADGPQGVPGRDGHTGPRGTPGSTGRMGVDGTNGVLGTPGQIGAAGAPGAPGPNGQMGPFGAPGRRGVMGVPGVGKTGAPGAPGGNGRNGKNGRNGSDGASGARGTDGTPGKRGSSPGAAPNGRNGANGKTPGGGGCAGWRMRILQGPGGMRNTPWIAEPGLRRMGEKIVPHINFGDVNSMRVQIPGTPNENFVWTFSGTVLVEKAGKYTFCSTSDDGSNVYIDGVQVVDDDGLHGPTERCGDVRLGQGKHIAFVDGFQAGGGGSVIVKYQGPDTFDKKVYVSSNDCDAHPGWDFRVFAGRNLLKVPMTRGMRQVGKSIIQTIDINQQSRFNFAVPATPQANFAWRIGGRIYVTEGGSYTFCLTSDDGSLLFIDGGRVVDHDGLHGSDEKCGGASLSAGLHDVSVEGFDHEGGASMTMKYSGPDTKGSKVFVRSVGHTVDVLRTY